MNLLIMKKVIITFTLLFQLCNSSDCETEINLSEEKLNEANLIAEICIENWEDYGCLPSVCVAQAILESNLGEECYPNNYWGLHGGYYSYDTLEDGVYAYMEFINEHYPSAPFILDCSEQIQVIYNGGYCQGNSNYANDINWIINEYNLVYYDQLLFEYLEQEKQKEHLLDTISGYSSAAVNFLSEHKEILEIINSLR